MSVVLQTVTPASLRGILRGKGEFALLDVREQEEFSRAHVLLACCTPLSRLELSVPRLVPCRMATVVVMDGGTDRDFDRARRAARKLVSMGYADVRVLQGGLEAWRQAGLVTVEGVGALSKGFGEYVEATKGTPRLEPAEVKALIDDPNVPTQVVDVRPVAEYRAMNIPGSVNLPGCEVTYRLADVVRDDRTVVIVNCAGRTRSIIGTQTLLNAGVPNRVVALKGGTMNWRLAGFDLEYGSPRPVPEITDEGRRVAERRIRNVAKAYAVGFVDPETVAGWRREADRRTLYLFDVRQPVEFAAGHIPGSVSAQGGQLVQATDEYAAVRNGRFVLIDDDELRAIMTAHWLRQMGLEHVAVLRGGLFRAGSVLAPSGLEKGEEAASAVDGGLTAREADAFLRRHADALIVDVAPSNVHRRRHVPNAKWVARAYMPVVRERFPEAGHLLVTADAPLLASLAAEDAGALWPDADVAFLNGTMDDWEACGLPVGQGMPCAMCAEDDVWYRPYTDVNASPEAMRSYFDWEFGLVDRINADGCVRFDTIVR